MFDYLDYKNRIPLNKCIVEIPKNLHPAHSNYKKFWIHNMFRKVVEGFWVNHNGDYKWIPGPLVLYTSLWSITMKVKGAKSAGKNIGRPRLRDLEWIKGYIHAAARGFSGFKNDNEYSCHRALIEAEEDDYQYMEPHILDSIKKKDGSFKIYKPVLEYLYEYQTSDLGKPLYYNEAKNVVDIEARDMGKSMISGCFIGHNFLTDGVMDFEEWLEEYYNKPEEERRIFNSNTLVSATDSSKSSLLIEKVDTGLKNVPGGVTVDNDYYPPPISKMTTGSWEANKSRVARYEIKEGGKMKWKGTNSSIMHRTFHKDPFRANGSRYSFGVVDEVGLMDNLLEVLGQLHDCTTVDRQKYGTIWMTGTGGDMDGGATEQVKKVFYDPAAYDCLEFDDLFENTGKKIGLFIPSAMAYEFRDEFGNVDRAKGQREVDKEALKKAKAKDKEALNSFLQMHPSKPSQAFLSSSGNIFPVQDLAAQLALVEASDDDYIKGTVGDMLIDTNGIVSFLPDVSAGSHNRELDYPIKKGQNNGGCVVIWEFPDKSPGYGYYIAGCDPYAKDKAENTQSVGSFLVLKRKSAFNSPMDRIVAEYTARPNRMEDFFEQCRRLLIFYNGVCLYENNWNHMKSYMQNKNSLHHMALSPGVIKASKESLSNSVYGLRMLEDTKEELELYLCDWLTTPVDGEKMNLHYIYSKGLLKELIAYAQGVNTDRAISLMLAVAQIIQMRKIVSDKKKEKIVDPFFSKPLFQNNR